MEINTNMLEKMMKVVEGLKSNPNIAKRLQDIFPNIDVPAGVILAILDNKAMFLKYARQDASFGKYLNINEAIRYIKSDDLLIYFADIQLYATVNSVEAFRTFQATASDYLEDSEGSSVNVRQIIFSYQRQKLVFTVQDNSPEIVKRISNIVEKCLHVSTCSVASGNNTEITVDNACTDHGHARDLFDKLYSCIISSMPELADVIKMLPVMVDDTLNDKYQRHIRPNINDTITSGRNWIEHLKHIPQGFKVDINVINTNCNIYNQCTISGKNQEHNAVLSWIKYNPPVNGEQTSVYHKRWESSKIDKMGIKEFNKFVCCRGYEIKKTPKFNVWIPSTK